MDDIRATLDSSPRKIKSGNGRVQNLDVSSRQEWITKRSARLMADKAKAVLESELG
jgi:hypothetical protein